MTEYITKERALEAFVRAMDFTDFEWDRVCEEMDFIPPADVAPVVHAQWEIPIFIDGNDELDPRVKCSECGAVEAAFARWKHCPNCGARMDGSENNA